MFYLIVIRFANISNFEETEIGGGDETKINFNIRKTHTLPVSNLK
jgi:hypothetical protein